MSSYRRKAIEEHGEECANCGAEEGIEVHHLNGDRADNDIENLLPLCRHCHTQLHRSGLNGWEEELKPTEERSQISSDTVSYQFKISKPEWERWKMTVPRSKSLDERVRELIEADADGRVAESPAGSAATPSESDAAPDPETDDEAADE